MSLKKIAEQTGVSISTVSRVLNNKDYNCASEEVKNKIWNAAREMNYVPNENARRLQQGSSDNHMVKKSIIVILGRFHSLDEDPFFGELFRSIEQEVFAKGCTIQRVIPSDDLTRGKVPEADGYLILGRSSQELLRKLQKRTKNIVAVTRNTTSFEIDEVFCDGKKAAEVAMEYLLEKGHTRIGYIGDCSYESRYIGYYETMIHNKVAMDYSYIYQTDQTEESGYKAMKQLLGQELVTAVFCANDATALGAIRAYNEYQKEKKSKVDLISIDNIKAAEEVSPLLTTVHVPEKEMGRMAVQILLDRMERGHQERMRVEFYSRLIKRESC